MGEKVTVEMHHGVRDGVLILTIPNIQTFAWAEIIKGHTPIIGRSRSDLLGEIKVGIDAIKKQVVLGFHPILDYACREALDQIAA